MTQEQGVRADRHGRKRRSIAEERRIVGLCDLSFLILLVRLAPRGSH